MGDPPQTIAPHIHFAELAALPDGFLGRGEQAIDATLVPAPASTSARRTRNVWRKARNLTGTKPCAGQRTWTPPYQEARQGLLSLKAQRERGPQARLHPQDLPSVPPANTTDTASMKCWTRTTWAGMCTPIRPIRQSVDKRSSGIGLSRWRWQCVRACLDQHAFASEMPLDPFPMKSQVFAGSHMLKQPLVLIGFHILVVTRCATKTKKCFSQLRRLGKMNRSLTSENINDQRHTAQAEPG